MLLKRSPVVYWRGARTTRRETELPAQQVALLAVWRSGELELPVRRSVAPRILPLDDSSLAGELAPDGSLVMIAWAAWCQPAGELVAALDGADRPSFAAARQVLRDRLAAAERAATPPLLAAVVDLRWGAHPIATMPIDQRIGFNLTHVPYYGGRLDVSGFVAEIAMAESDVRVAVLLRPPMLSPVEDATVRLLDPETGQPRFLEEPPSFIGKIVKGVEKGAKAVGRGVEKGAKAVGQGVEKGAKVVGQGVEQGAKVVGKGVEKGAKVVGVDAQNVAKAGQEVAKGVGRVLMQQNKAAMQEEAAGRQGVGPGAEDAGGADAADAAAGADAGADAADAAEGALAVAGAVARADVFAAQGDFGLPPEPDVETLLAYRNRVLVSSQ